jgi:N-acetylglucosaminyldiphosphoundecaprenol N-acetyl-beta-D-mannosaminyltransferase
VLNGRTLLTTRCLRDATDVVSAINANTTLIIVAFCPGVLSAAKKNGVNVHMSGILEVPWIPLGGLPIAVIDCDESARLMISSALAKRDSHTPPLFITSANGQVLSMCARDEELLALFLAADLIHADGTPLVMASKWQSRTPLPERTATTDLFHNVAREAQSRGASFYFLGGAPDIIKRTVQAVRRQYPRLTICGFRHGYFGDDECQGVIDEINAARPDVLWVGMGVPREQIFSLRHRHQLTRVGIIKTSGGLFDFLSERNRRAPMWMQQAGLEWLFRLALEPRRLFARYLLTNPHALYLLIARRAQLNRLPAHWYARPDSPLPAAQSRAIAAE